MTARLNKQALLSGGTVTEDMVDEALGVLKRSPKWRNIFVGIYKTMMVDQHGIVSFTTKGVDQYWRAHGRPKLDTANYTSQASSDSFGKMTRETPDTIAPMKGMFRHRDIEDGKPKHNGIMIIDPEWKIKVFDRWISENPELVGIQPTPVVTPMDDLLRLVHNVPIMDALGKDMDLLSRLCSTTGDDPELTMFRNDPFAAAFAIVFSKLSSMLGKKVPVMDETLIVILNNVVDQPLPKRKRLVRSIKLLKDLGLIVGQGRNLFPGFMLDGTVQELRAIITRIESEDELPVMDCDGALHELTRRTSNMTPSQTLTLLTGEEWSDRRRLEVLKTKFDFDRVQQTLYALFQSTDGDPDERGRIIVDMDCLMSDAHKAYVRFMRKQSISDEWVIRKLLKGTIDMYCLLCGCIEKDEYEADLILTKYGTSVLHAYKPIAIEQQIREDNADEAEEQRLKRARVAREEAHGWTNWHYGA